MNLIKDTPLDESFSGPDSPRASGWDFEKLQLSEICIANREWHRLMTVIAQAPDRAQAAEAFVKQLSHQLPDHTIRLGWAVERSESSQASQWQLDRVFDSRLGWLDQDNSVYQSLATRFSETAEGLDRIRWESVSLLLELREDESANHRAVVWIRPPQSDDETLNRFKEFIPEEVLVATAAVFFSRPVSGTWEHVVHAVHRCWSRRASIGIGLLLAMMIACVPAAYQVDAVATVTAMDARRIAAPIDATLLTVHKRPGDLVVTGEPLFELDGRPLRIELEALTAEIEEATKDEDISLANGEIAKAQLAGLRRQSLSRRRELIIDRMDQLIVISPIDGVVIQGDWQHALGSPLEIGQTLLEIAPSDSVEIELEIPEVEIGYVATKADVKLWFPAVGTSDFQTSVQTIYPAATIRDDQNVFIAKTPMPGVEATSDENASREMVTPLRVGMRGEAVVIGPMRPWIWKWVRLPIRRVGWVIGW